MWVSNPTPPLFLPVQPFRNKGFFRVVKNNRERVFTNPSAWVSFFSVSRR